MSTVRGRPPCVFCLAGGSIGPTIAHGSSGRSEDTPSETGHIPACWRTPLWMGNAPPI